MPHLAKLVNEALMQIISMAGARDQKSKEREFR
jgi:hypothetical protein